VPVKFIPLTPRERRAVGGLAGIFALRLLGLFLILPVFALYAERLQGQTPFLVGLALGIYGLTQGLLQIPYGMVSDRLGRKPVIVAGLLVFAAGSVIAALADTIYGVLLGRALQGAGAISAVVMALIADLTRPESRTKAMALVGMTVGASFVLALILGPVLNNLWGVPGLFWLTAALAVAGIGVLGWWVPAPTRQPATVAPEVRPRQLLKVLRNARLLRLNVGIFILHSVLTAVFVVIPVALVKHADFPLRQHWEVYLPVMLLSAVFLFPLIMLAERKRRFRLVFAGAVLLLAFAQALLWAGYQSLGAVIIGLFLFFTAFNVLEAMLPSLISKIAPAHAKGAALGVYSSFQFLGAFVGGAVGGWLYGRYGIPVVLGFNAGLLALWFLVAVSMRPSEYLDRGLPPLADIQSSEKKS
jgi:MFS family permease